MSTTSTPAPPPPPAPTATIEANPSSVQPGDQVTITWKTENAGEVAIDPMGPVQPSGSQTVSPKESTTYRLTAKGPGGTQESDARVTVNAGVAAKPATNTQEDDLIDAATTRRDVFFDYNDFAIRADQLDTIKNDVDFLKLHPRVLIVVEGHCDETGSTEYNLALGERRAAEVKDALQKAGINAARIQTISYGKEKPYCMEENDDCWRMNRRAHIAIQIER